MNSSGLLIRKRKNAFKQDEGLLEWQRPNTTDRPTQQMILKKHPSKMDILTVIEINHQHNASLWILKIPTEIFYHILEFIAPSAFPSLHLVCQHLHEVMKSSWIWKKLWKVQGWREEERSGIDHHVKWRNRFLMKATTEANWMNGKFLSRDLSLKFPQRALFPSPIAHLSDDYIVCGHHTIDSDFHLLVIDHNKEIISSAQIPYEASSSIHVPERSKDIWYSIPNQNRKCMLWNVLSKNLYSVNIGETTQELVFDVGKICYATSTALSVVDLATERTRGSVLMDGIANLALDSLQPNRIALKQQSTVQLWDIKNFQMTHKIDGKFGVKSFQARENLVALSYRGSNTVDLYDIRSSSVPLQKFTQPGGNLDMFQFDDTKMVASSGNNISVFNMKTGQLASEIKDVGCTLQHMCFHGDKLLLVNFLLMKVLYFGNWHSLYFPDQRPLKKPKPKIKFNLSFS